MPYTAQQLINAQTAANLGVAPNAAVTANLTKLAGQTQTAEVTDAAALSAVINGADTTTAVAALAYQFFTGKSPTKAGFDFLVNSAANPNDLNDPYYAQFNIENRYINFAANLGLFGEGAAGFAAAYGPMSFPTFVAVLYEQIIGTPYAQAAGINVTAALADITGRQSAFVQTARDRGLINANSTAAQVDIATKAAVVGYLMVEGIKADVGIFAAGSNNFVNALINGTAQFNVDLLSVYAPFGGGVGSPLPPAGLTIALTTGIDALTGGANADTFNGAIYAAPAAPNVTTFQITDTLVGGSGLDTLNVTIAHATGGATGAVTIPSAAVSGIETINLRFQSATAADIATLDATAFIGATTFNSDKSTANLVLNNLVAGTAIGVTGVGSTGALGLFLKDASGTTDQVTIALNNLNTSFAANTAGVAVSTLTLGGSTTAGQIETLNLVSEGNITGSGAYNSVTLAASGGAPFADPSTIKVSGAQGLTLTTGVLGHTLAVDAASNTAGLVFSSNAGGAFAVEVTGTAKNDTITLGAGQTGTIRGGGGGDSIVITAAAGQQIIGYKSGADSTVDLTGTSGSSGTFTANAGAMDRITGFQTGVDKISLQEVSIALFQPQVIVDKGAAADNAAAATLLASATFFQDGGGVLRRVAQFDLAGGTMLVADSNASGAYDAGDLAIYLVGVTNVATGDLLGS